MSQLKTDSSPFTAAYLKAAAIGAIAAAVFYFGVVLGIFAHAPITKGTYFGRVMTDPINFLSFLAFAIASRDDMPGISRLLAGWRDEEAELKEKLEQAHGEGTISPQAIQIMAHLDELMTRLSEANREKLAFAIRQTVKQITLRRERRGDGKHRITLWDGEIELREELGTNATLTLTDDDVPSPGRWREVADFIRQRGDVVFFRDVCEHLGRKGSFVSRLLAQAVLSGKVRNLGHQRGWIAND